MFNDDDDDDDVGTTHSPAFLVVPGSAKEGAKGRGNDGGGRKGACDLF